MIQPKPYLDNFKYRNRSFGKEQRLNMSKLILDKGTPFPKGVEIKDIDQTFVEWVENVLNLSFNGQEIPTFRLFSNQRINEYSQTWQHLDEVGNLLMNFKTITRENNPQKGQNQGDSYNIPGNHDYPMFIVPVLQENGVEAYDMYSMKQPYSLDLIYTVSIITNKYELLNKMNQLVNYQFKAFTAYIFPNNHAMPMSLESISDESEYAIDDRKYYSQSYQIKIRAYIIHQDDFKVTRLPSRIKTSILGMDERKSKKDVLIEIEEDEYIPLCSSNEDESQYHNQPIKLTITIPDCSVDTTFTFDSDMIIETIETVNIFDFVMSINGEYQNFENDETRLYKDDDVYIKIERENPMESSLLIIRGFNPNIILDKNFDPESSLDGLNREDILY